jgi:hypothetical protein
MFETRIDTRELSEFGKWGKIIKKISIDTPIKGNKIIDTLAKQTQRGMQMRAPRDTGKLAKSIIIKPMGIHGLEIEVGGNTSRPYAFYQEYGFTPHGVSITRPEIRSYIRRHGIRVKGKYLWVSKHTPFVEPTISQTLSNANVARVIDSHIKNLGG